MADRTTFPLDNSRGFTRAATIFGGVLMTLICGAATLWLALGSIVPFLYEGLWPTALLLLPMAAFAGWFTGYAVLLLEHVVSRVEVGAEGVTLIRPWRKAKAYPWSDFWQVCVCYSSGTPGKNDGVPVLCFVRHGEKRNLYDRWKADNPWHYGRLIVADCTEEMQEAVRSVCPMEVADLRGSPAYPLK